MSEMKNKPRRFVIISVVIATGVWQSPIQLQAFLCVACRASQDIQQLDPDFYMQRLDRNIARQR
eukprot:2095045-Amphidinium_carterae.1